MSQRRTHESGPVVTLPITPMLDMSFQLLFFFMATFNPTDREGAQILAIAQEKKAEEQQVTSPTAPNPLKVDQRVIPGEKPKQLEEPEPDTKLLLYIENGGSSEHPHLTYDLTIGGRKSLSKGNIETPRKGETWFNPGNRELTRELIKALEDKKHEVSTKVKDDLRKADKPEGSEEFKKVYDGEYEKEMAKNKLRIQTNADSPWSLSFETMNYCTNLGFKIALTTPKGYVPKIQPK